jgi:lipid A 3-O-deacylase
MGWITPQWRIMSVKGILTTSFIVIALLNLWTGPVFADDNISPTHVPDRYGMGLVTGNTYDPTNDITFVQASLFGLFDYGKVWRNNAPEALRFKVEGNVGTTTRPDKRLIVSANIFSLYYINILASETFKPYVEGGIGIIYTDFKVDGQGLRFNFNPQLGIGAEIDAASKNPLLLSLRLHHVSNGGLDKDNRGINAVTINLGRFF